MSADGDACLSKRAQVLSGEDCFLMKYYTASVRNQWSPENLGGVTNLGTAENFLCEELLVEKFRDPKMFEFETPMLHYYTYEGNTRTRAIVSRFIQKHMQADHKLDPEHLTMVLGTCSALDISAHIIADPGDVLLCPAPFYTRIRANCYERALVGIYPVNLSSRPAPGETSPFELTVDRVKAAYAQAVSEGKNVKGMVILNPSNPLGTVCSRERLLPILEFLSEKRLYCIMDEIYALSTFNIGKDSRFDSVLSYWKELPDPTRVVWLWGISKDFGNGGARTSFIYSQNRQFMDCVKKLVVFQCVPITMHKMVEEFFLDEAWLDDVYLPTNLARMRENYDLAEDRLRRLGIPFVTARAGLFIFADFRQLMKEQTFAEERALFERFFKAGVYIVPGGSLYCKEPGWFRIVFTVRRETLEEGLNRIGKVLTE